MGANTSTAVMQRRSEPHNSLDDFPTPPWATRALCERIHSTPPRWNMICREPAANRGHMVRPLREYFVHVEASDVHDYGMGFAVADYLFGPDPEPVDWTITNPPFRLAEQFIDRAIRTSRVGVAMIVRTAFLEGIGRYNRLFTVSPPARVLQFSERAPMVRGRLDSEASSATAYCWILWECRHSGPTQLEWIAPCRTRLERHGDYSTRTAQAART